MFLREVLCSLLLPETSAQKIDLISTTVLPFSPFVGIEQMRGEAGDIPAAGG